MLLEMLRKPDVFKATGFKNTTLHNEIKKRRFPPGVKLTSDGRVVGFPAHEVQQIVKARIAGKSEAEIAALVEKIIAARSTEVIA